MSADGSTGEWYNGLGSPSVLSASGTTTRFLINFAISFDVSKIEEFFGVLWGENEDVDEKNMTSEQKKWFNKFLDLRDCIFNQGNSEKKKMLNEISSFKITIKETKIHAGQ